jgi:hypothetical protein
MEDREVEDGEWRGLSKGDAETLGTDESVPGLRFSAMRLGIAVEDIFSGVSGIPKIYISNGCLSVSCKLKLVLRCGRW